MSQSQPDVTDMVQDQPNNSASSNSDEDDALSFGEEKDRKN